LSVAVQKIHLKCHRKGQGVDHRTALWRYNEDGTYNNKPADKAYFAKYMAVRHMCTCGKMVAVGEIYKHKKYKICIKLTAQRMAAIENDS
jgi:hypothetical protein